MRVRCIKSLAKLNCLLDDTSRMIRLGWQAAGVMSSTH